MIDDTRQPAAALSYPELKLIVIRHGETASNENGIMRGWNDVPLSDEGRLDAKNIAMRLRNNPPDCIISSDLERAKETAQIISDGCGAPIEAYMKGLRSWNVGNYVGQKSEDIEWDLLYYAFDKPDEVVGGGESFNTFKTRFLSCIEEIVKNYSGKNVALITHHRGERLLAAWCLCGENENYEINNFTFQLMGIPPGSFREQILCNYNL